MQAFILSAACGLTLSAAACVHAQATHRAAEESATSSLLVTTPPLPSETQDVKEDPHALRAVSMFAIAPPKPRTFAEHDLVQIIVRETSQAKSTHELETTKESKIDAAVKAWPDLQLQDLLELRINAGRTANLPSLDVEANKEFTGEGDYKRQDDLSARLTAEVVQVLPNGNLVLEARTHIKTDQEEQIMKVTGVCRPEDITAANTVLSNQIHDLTIEKVHKGELKKAGEKGIISKVLETVFAF